MRRRPPSDDSRASASLASSSVSSSSPDSSPSAAPNRAGGAASWRYVDSPGSLAALLEELEGVPEYAIDTEFHRERTYFPRLALVQIAWAGGLALVDPLATDVAPLRTLLESDAVAVLHAADQDLEILELECGTVPKVIFDTQVSAGFVGYASPSLVALIEHELQVRLHKADQLTDWTRRPLSTAQQAYAAGDVAHLLELRRVLSTRLESLGRLDWAAEECALLLARDRSATEPSRAWWRLPHSRQLRGAGRGVAQEVAAWRERRASSLDVPVRFVLSDLAVMSIAQRPPTSREELLRSRGVDPRHLTGTAADDLLASVTRGRNLPSSQLNLPPRHPLERPNRPVIALASAYAGQLAGELELDPAILATRADVAAFFQTPRSGRLVSGWRHELIGASLERLSGGEAALAFDGDDKLVLEERSRRPL
jgi:ribonuclease D